MLWWWLLQSEVIINCLIDNFSSFNFFAFWTCFRVWSPYSMLTRSVNSQATTTKEQIQRVNIRPFKIVAMLWSPQNFWLMIFTSQLAITHTISNFPISFLSRFYFIISLVHFYLAISQEGRLKHLIIQSKTLAFFINIFSKPHFLQRKNLKLSKFSNYHIEQRSLCAEHFETLVKIKSPDFVYF